MDYLIIILVTISASALTFLSGFGLGTLLLPVFTFFFPVNVAVAATAIVHLANNIFKAFLMGHKADYAIVLRFALPAAIFAILGALLLNYVGHLPPMTRYSMMNQTFSVTPIKLVVALLMAGFAVLELAPGFQKLSFSPKLVPLGGALSGFFGGLSGHQGALRSAFLVRLGLEKETFVGTIIFSAIVVDVTRLIVYGATFFSDDVMRFLYQGQLGLIGIGCLAAFVGSVAGFYMVKKVTMRFIQLLIGVLLVVYAVVLGLGLI